MNLRTVDSILELVGVTPMVRINRLNPNPKVSVLAKLEFMNPGGSVKDRPALRMIEAAEQSGELTPDKIVLEATSGNTGIGLAMVCAVKGYRMLFAMSESASVERRKILKAYGADILITPAHLSTDGAIEEAYRLAREEPDKYFLVDQFNNQDNWRSHYEGGTADEISQGAGPDLKAVVSTMGTTGTLMGIAMRMAETNPEVNVIGVEPYQGHKIQGLKNMKESYPPGIFDPSKIPSIVNIEDDDAYETARLLAREEGIFVGMSSGAAMRAALDAAAELEEGVVVAILPDGGERYLSTPLFVSEKVPVPLSFFNTLTSQVEDLAPVRPGQVGIYACGPSLDGPVDMGLCRRMVFADLIKRYLEFRRFEVKLVINIADCDDRTVNQCLKEKQPIKAFTEKWEKAFFEDMWRLNVAPASHYPKASEHVGEMIDQTKALLDKGLAYEKLRSVYFNISRYEDYGKLSGMDLNAIQSGKTVDYDYYEKENPSDFTLFKRATLAELKAGIYWQTPWGSVRPGWHVECACMSAGHLGQPFDMHLASKDLIFPHGDNEIAVAEGLTGKPLANMWLHSEVVMHNGHKVSRAAGNDLTLKDMLDMGYTAETVRYWLISHHYSRAINFLPEDLKAAERSLHRLNEFYCRLCFAKPGKTSDDLEQLIYDTRSNMTQAADHDLGIPQSLGQFFTFIKQVNRLLTEGLMDDEQIQRTIKFVRSVDKVLAVMDLAPQEVDPEIERLMAGRQKAREAKDFATADAIRNQLTDMGIEVIDTPTGTRWRRR